MELNDVLRLRRSVYALDKNVKVSDDEIRAIVETSLLHTPTGFNSQGPRAVLLLGKGHEKLWSLTREALRQVVPAAAFKSTEDKINSFAAAYGTVVYFEEEAIVKNLQEKYSLYAANFPIWATQSNGMLQQNVWFGLTQAGLGASLQHYNELIEEAFRKEFDIPASWKMVGQMPFGNPVGTPNPKEFVPVETRLKVIN
jgi:predicted oxidoreductase (fatty acid repression mutant protein)